MSMDPARARFPECTICGFGVDENDPDNDYEMHNSLYFHAKCLTDEETLPAGTDWPSDEAHRMSEAQELKR